MRSQKGFWFGSAKKRNISDITEHIHVCRMWRDCGVAEFIRLSGTVTNRNNIRAEIKNSHCMYQQLHYSWIQ